MSQRRPQTFLEHYRAENWRFARYRAFGGEEPGDTTYAENRTRWLHHPFGRRGRPRLRPRGLKTFRPRNYVVAPRRGLYGAVKDRYTRVRNWFTAQGMFTRVRTLGYGGLGLAIHFVWRGPQVGAPSRDVVLKVGLNDWQDEDLRDEEESTRKMERAAHVIQAIRPQDVGMPPKTKFRFEEPILEDSSEEKESSGSDSRSDTNPRTHSRRWMMENQLDQMKAKWRRHKVRYTRQNLRNKNRRIMRGELRRQEVMHGSSPAIDDAYRRWQIDRKDYLLLEYLQYGDLAHLIYKLQALGQETIPNRVLWSFWLCLVRACVAMEFPPRKFHPMRHGPPGVGDNVSVEVGELLAGRGEPSWKAFGNDLFEDIPLPRRRWHAKHIVHFDIDPKNILIGEIDEGTRNHEHRWIPRLKLADWGCAKAVKRNKGNAYYFERRRYSKEGYFAPEQFGPEWEHIDVKTPRGWELSEQRVAGNYGSPMNVWGIALVMWQIITKSVVPTPPRWNPGSHQYPYEPLTYCALLITDDRFDWVDPELRNTLIHCLRHDPAERPTVIHLLRHAKKCVHKYFPGESNRVIREWVQTVIRDGLHPLPPGPPDFVGLGGGGLPPRPHTI